MSIYTLVVSEWAGERMNELLISFNSLSQKCGGWVRVKFNGATNAQTVLTTTPFVSRWLGVKIQQNYLIKFHAKDTEVHIWRDLETKWLGHFLEVEGHHIKYRLQTVWGICTHIGFVRFLGWFMKEVILLDQFLHLKERKQKLQLQGFAQNNVWVGSRKCGCLVTWFCYKLIAKPGNKTATPLWPKLCISNREYNSQYLALSCFYCNYWISASWIC